MGRSTAEIADAIGQSARLGRSRADRLRGAGSELRSDNAKQLLRFSGQLPVPEGAVFAKALDRIVTQTDTGAAPMRYEQRLADALVELSSTRLSDESDADRATVAVYVPFAVVAGDVGVAELEDGDAIAAETARRLLCDARWYVVVDGPDGTPIGVGRTTRQVPPWLLREVKRRDLGCTFPVAAEGDGLMRTTFCRGHAGDRPTSTTSRSSVARTIDWSTKVAGRSLAIAKVD